MVRRAGSRHLAVTSRNDHLPAGEPDRKPLAQIRDRESTERGFFDAKLIAGNRRVEQHPSRYVTLRTAAKLDRAVSMHELSLSVLVDQGDPEHGTRFLGGEGRTSSSPLSLQCTTMTATLPQEQGGPAPPWLRFKTLRREDSPSHCLVQAAGRGEPTPADENALRFLFLCVDQRNRSRIRRLARSS